MRLSSSDPDIESIYNRIRNQQWNLQPEFQRGEVWSEQKKARLIDTILRGWHVPPIHLVRVENTNEEVVLDGQQRLAAIRDFKRGELKVYGRFPPSDSVIQSMHGLRFEELPTEVKRLFDRQSIRVLTILEYEPDEPGELFLRLNQPTGLTTAEQRNAFFGPVRTQIKELVKEGGRYGFNESAVGFSNSRMAYDDVLARLATTLIQGSLWEKVSAGTVAELYRNKTPLPHNVVTRISSSLSILAESVSNSSLYSSQFIQKFRFNKATLFSWLLFLAIAAPKKNSTTTRSLGNFIVGFEMVRETIKLLGDDLNTGAKIFPNFENPTKLIEIYNDRASARVTDAASVVLRDAVTWILAAKFPELAKISPQFDSRAKKALNIFALVNSHTSSISLESSMLDLLKEDQWGDAL